MSAPVPLPHTHEDLLACTAHWKRDMIHRILGILQARSNTDWAVAPFLWSVQDLLTDAVMAPILQELESSCTALDQSFKKMEQALETERAAIDMYLRHLDTQKRDFTLKRPMYESDSESQTEDEWIPEAASVPCAPPIEWKSLHSIMVRAGMWKRNTPKALRARFLNYLNGKWKEAFQTEPRQFGNVWMYPETPAVREYILSLYTDFKRLV
eukprot:m51a1_g10606 hypothetical protein (211) ;mRNA; f:39724-40356